MDVGEGKPSLRRVRQRNGIGGGADFRHHLGQFDQPLRRTGRALQVAPHFRQGADRSGDDDGVEDEGRQFAAGHGAVRHISGPEPEHGVDGTEDQQDDDGRQPGAHGDPLPRHGEGLANRVAETPPLEFLLREGLHGLDRVQAFLRPGIDRRYLVLAQPRQLAQPAPEEDDRHHDDGHHGQDQPGQLRAGDDQHGQTTDEHQQVAQRHGGAGADDRLDQFGVHGQAAHHLAGLGLLIEVPVQADDMAIHGLANVGDDPLPQPGDRVVAGEGKGGEQGEDTEQGNEILVEQLSIGCAEPIVDHPSDRLTDGQCRGGGTGQGDDGEHDLQAIGPREWHQATQGADLLRLRAPGFLVIGLTLVSRNGFFRHVAPR